GEFGAEEHAVVAELVTLCAKFFEMLAASATGVSPEWGFVEGFFHAIDLGFFLVTGFGEATPHGGHALFNFGIVELGELTDVERGELIARDSVCGDRVEQREGVGGSRGQDAEG